MPTILNFPYSLDIPTPDGCDPLYYPAYNQFLCKAILAATDYTELPNSGIVNVQDFTTYRAQIRAILFAEPQELITELPVLPTSTR